MRRYWTAVIKIFIASLTLSILSILIGKWLSCSTNDCVSWQFFINDLCAGTFMLGCAGMTLAFLIAVILIPFQMVSNARKENNQRTDYTYD